MPPSSPQERAAGSSHRGRDGPGPCNRPGSSRKPCAGTRAPPRRVLDQRLIGRVRERLPLPSLTLPPARLPEIARSARWVPTITSRCSQRTAQARRDARALGSPTISAQRARSRRRIVTALVFSDSEHGPRNFRARIQSSSTPSISAACSRREDVVAGGHDAPPFCSARYSAKSRAVDTQPAAQSESPAASVLVGRTRARGCNPNAPRLPRPSASSASLRPCRQCTLIPS